MRPYGLVFTIFAFSSHAQHQTGLIFKDNNLTPKKKYTIQLGALGVSGITMAETMIYRKKDGYVALYDGNQLNDTGRPFATHIEFDTSNTGCTIDGKPFEGQVYQSELLPSNIESAPNSLFSKKPLAVVFPAGECPANKITVRILGPTCLSPDPACKKLKTYQTYKVLPGDLHFLDAIEDENDLKKLPGLKSVDE